jgi:hypothetical protein
MPIKCVLMTQPLNMACTTKIGWLFDVGEQNLFVGYGMAFGEWHLWVRA